MNESLDCRVCEHYELVYEEYPSEDEPVVVYSFHKCLASGSIYFLTSELKEAYNSCSRRAIKIGYGTPSEILNEIKLINLSFWQLLGEKIDLIKITPGQATFMSSPCYSHVDLVNKIGVLASLIDINIDALRKLVTNYEKDWKGLKLLEALFKEKGIYSDEIEVALKILRDIVLLRNKILPYHHPSEKEALEISERLGIRLNVTSESEWQKNADILLKKFLSALRTLKNTLLDLAMEN